VGSINLAGFLRHPVGGRDRDELVRETRRPTNIWCNKGGRFTTAQQVWIKGGESASRLQKEQVWEGPLQIQNPPSHQGNSPIQDESEVEHSLATRGKTKRKRSKTKGTREKGTCRSRVKQTLRQGGIKTEHWQVKRISDRPMEGGRKGRGEKGTIATDKGRRVMKGEARGKNVVDGKESKRRTQAGVEIG